VSALLASVPEIKTPLLVLVKVHAPEAEGKLLAL